MSLSSVSNPSNKTNPFAIRNHVDEILDLKKPNYTTWNTLFMVHFHKFGLLDYIDGIVDACNRTNDIEWMRVDHTIDSWLYNTVSKDIRDMILRPSDTAYDCWVTIYNLFLDNQLQRAVYAQQEFHDLFQDDRSVTEYCHQLKILADTLRDVGSPISSQQLIINLLHGLQAEFNHAVAILNVHPKTFHGTCSYLENKEHRLADLTKRASTNALMADVQLHGARPPATPPAVLPPGGNYWRKKKNNNNNEARASAPIAHAAPAAPWMRPRASINLRTGMV
jgi:hypothetical protein